jgi:hypothetical protein
VLFDAHELGELDGVPTTDKTVKDFGSYGRWQCLQTFQIQIVGSGERVAFEGTDFLLNPEPHRFALFCEALDSIS